MSVKLFVDEDTCGSHNHLSSWRIYSHAILYGHVQLVCHGWYTRRQSKIVDLPAIHCTAYTNSRGDLVGMGILQAEETTPTFERGRCQARQEYLLIPKLSCVDEPIEV